MTAYLDQPSNFAYVTALQGYASGVTTITLQSGDGSRLPATAGYNLVWWDDTDFPGNPAADTLREIIRVTARSGDVLTTIVRAQESTTNNNHNIGGKTYRLALCVTKKTIDDIDAKISGLVKSRFKANVAVDQTISQATLTKVKYATEQYDAASEYNPADPKIGRAHV